MNGKRIDTFAQPSPARKGNEAMKRNVFSLSVATALVLFGTGVALADNIVVGELSNIDLDILSADNWETVRSVDVVIPAGDGAHACVATASADIAATSPVVNVENKYRFVLTRNDNNPFTNNGSERTAELVDNDGVNDPDTVLVATTRHFLGVRDDNGVNGTGTHTFRLLGRKVDQSMADGRVEDASVSVICVDTD
jgi:hypothetical protein